MKTISESIRTLRRSNGYTQEALAEKLGVTAQTVSKWESGTTFPDISMVIPLASVFGVSTDVIFGVTADSQEREIEETRRFLEKPEISNAECVKRWRAVVERYPNNYTARLELANALHCLATEGEETEENFAPAIAQYERIVDECTDEDIRSEAISVLINDYSRVGKVSEAIKAARKMPTIHSSRDVLLAQINGSPTQKEDVQKLIDFCVLDAAWHLREQKYDTAEDKIHACKAALAVLDAVYYDGHAKKCAGRDYPELYLALASAYASLGQTAEAFENLDLAFDETANREALPFGTYSYAENKFVSAASYDHNVESNGAEWVYLAYNLCKNSFDPIRKDEKFIKFEKKVRTFVAEKGQTEMLEEWLAE